MSWPGTFGPKDVLRLVDAKGAAVLEFTEVENGMFESERGAEGLLFLQHPGALKVETRTAEQLVGDWSLLHEVDKPLCRLTLSNHRERRRLPRDRQAGLRQGDRHLQPVDLAARPRPAASSPGATASGGSPKATPRSGSGCR